MFCKKCGEENPDNAVYCRNCGTKLVEEVKKTTVIETEGSNQNTQSTQTTSNTSSSGNSSDWTSCCICLVAVFIVFAILGMLGF